MPEVSSTHLVLIPSYNTGRKLVSTVQSALAIWNPVWVVVDGSTDGSENALESLPEHGTRALNVIRLPENVGKGAAVLQGVKAALAQGFTHVLTMDSDGQHASNSILDLMRASLAQPEALVLGKPVFDDSAPAIRLRGRRLANWWARFETMADIGDCLFGLRVYPAKALEEVMEESPWARRFDFDPEVAMRLCWKGHRPVNIPAPCQYFTKDEGGVSHFNYYRDNVLLTWMFARLLVGFAWRWPQLLRQKRKHLYYENS